MYEIKSLDQMVLENLNDAKDEEQNEEVVESLNESDEIGSNEVEVKQ